MNNVKKGGRKKGIPNKVTGEIRQAYKQLIEDNLSNIEDWLHRTAKDHPERALLFNSNSIKLWNVIYKLP